MDKFIKQVGNKEKVKKKISLADNKKSILIGAGILVALGAIAFFVGGGGTQVEVKTGISQRDVKQTITEVVRPLYEKQQKLEKQQEETVNTLNKLEKVLASLNETLKKEKEGNSLQPNTTERKPIAPPIAPPTQIITEKGVQVQVKKEEPLFRHIEVNTVEGQGKKTEKVRIGMYQVKKKKTNPSVYIPAGSIAEGKLLYGFVAPESGMFPPVVVEFTKPIRTANDFYIPAQKCLITTSAQYDISQGLAILGGLKSTMSCVLRNGKVVEIPVNVAVGEEKKGGTVQIGLTGQEVWLTGKDFATLTTMVSLGSMANSYKQGLVQQSMTPQGNVITAIKNRGLYSVLGGVSAGVNKFVDFWMKKYDKKVPAIKVKPKKRVFIVFVNGADLGITPKEL